MNIKEFLEQVNTGLLPKSSVFLFVGDPLSPRLVSIFSRRISQPLGIQEPVVWVRSDDEVPQLLAQLHVSFLGGGRFYWLGACADYDLSARDALKQLIPHYTGPHVIGLSATAEEAKRLQKGGGAAITLIELPQVVDDEKVFLLLAQLLGCERGELVKFYRSIRGAGLNELAELLVYVSVIADEGGQFCDAWVPRIFAAEESLFELSKLFFGKDKQAFLRLWKKIGPFYPPEFWGVFWMEQFWQAWLVVSAMKRQGVVPERRFINRLPFSFTQRDWKKYQERELVAVHNALYHVDYALKNGGDAGALEAVLVRFLVGGFARV